MPVTLATPLPQITFSKNPVLLTPVSDDYLAAAPATAVNYFEFSAVVAVDTAVVLSWTDNSVTMTAKAAPDGSGNQFPNGDGGTTYVTTLVAFFKANYFIDRDFVVTANVTDYAHPRLIFTAREQGADFNFNGTAPTGVITAGADNSPVSNFMHHVEVWIANLNGGFDQAFDANVSLDENPITGQSTIDIHDTLHSWLSQPGEFDTPLIGALYAKYISSLRAYYVKYAQFFGDVPAIQKVNTSAICYVALGGLGMKNALVRNIISELRPVTGDATKDRFLRQGSKNKQVTKEQPEWLSYINFTGGDITVDLEISIYNDDATSNTFNAVEDLIIHAWEKYQFAVGFTQLNIVGQQSAAKKPVYYTARLKSAAGYLTDTYSFAIDYNYREFSRYFVYENAYGAYQTIATVGKGQNEADRTKTDAQLAVNKTTGAATGEFLETNIYFQEKGTANIGYDRAGTRNTRLLRDLIASHRIFLYDPAASSAQAKLIPIGLNTKNIKDAMDGTNVYAGVIEWYPLYQEEVFTEDAGMADDSLSRLITDAGSPVPGIVPVTVTGNNIIVESTDVHLSVVGGNQVYTAGVLIGLTGYRIYASQLAVYFRTADIAYNSVAGSFTILDPGFRLNPGDQLIIWPYILIP